MILFPECLIIPFYIFLHLIVAFKMYHVLDCKDSRPLSLAFCLNKDTYYLLTHLLTYSLTHLLTYSLAKLDMDSSLDSPAGRLTLNLSLKMAYLIMITPMDNKDWQKKKKLRLSDVVCCSSQYRNP